MIHMFAQELHTYVNGEKRAEVWRTQDGQFGCRFWKNNVHQTDEIYEGHNEEYAETAAENYVFGIKTLLLG